MQKNEYEPNNAKFEIRPASSEEAGLFYALPPEQDEALGAIGHVRIDFGRSGSEFWHTWHPRGPAELNSPEFKTELQEVVDELRKSVLKNFSAMTGYDNPIHVIQKERYTLWQLTRKSSRSPPSPR